MAYLFYYARNNFLHCCCEQRIIKWCASCDSQIHLRVKARSHYSRVRACPL